MVEEESILLADQSSRRIRSERNKYGPAVVTQVCCYFSKRKMAENPELQRTSEPKPSPRLEKTISVAKTSDNSATAKKPRMKKGSFPNPFALVDVHQTLNLHKVGAPVPQDKHRERPGPDQTEPGRPKPLRPLYSHCVASEFERIYRARYLCLRPEAYALCASKRYPGGYLVRACEGFFIKAGTTVSHQTQLDLWVEEGLMGVVSGVPEHLDDPRRPQVWCDTITDRTAETGLEVILRNRTEEEIVVKRGQNLALLQFVQVKRIQFRLILREDRDRIVPVNSSDDLSDNEVIQEHKKRRRDQKGFHELHGEDLGENVMNLDDLGEEDPLRQSLEERIEDLEDGAGTVTETPCYTKILLEKEPTPACTSQSVPEVSITPVKAETAKKAPKKPSRRLYHAERAKESYADRKEVRRLRILKEKEMEASQKESADEGGAGEGDSSRSPVSV